MAHVTQLEIVEGENDVFFHFNWEGSDWHAALNAVKSQIPSEARSFDPKTTLWSVSTAFEYTLAEIFPNFASRLDAIRSQVSLF